MQMQTPRPARRRARAALSCLLTALPLAVLPSAAALATPLDPPADGAADGPAATLHRPASATSHLVVLDAATVLGRGDGRPHPGDVDAGRASVTDPVAPAETEALAAAVRAQAQRIRDLGGVVTAELTTVGAVAAELTEEQLDRVRRDPVVAWVEQDVAAAAPVPVARGAAAGEPAALPWGLDRIDQRALPLDGRFDPPGDGRGVSIYFVDSGIDPRHEAFTGRVRAGIDTVGDGSGAPDCSGHGTHTAGTAAGKGIGVAPGAEIVSVRVLGCDNTATYAGLIEGLDWVGATATPPAVVNVSVNSPSSATFDLAVQRLLDRGLVVVASAGNAAEDACLESPTRVPGVLTVGATTDSDRLARVSNHGECVDVLAPGFRVLSARMGAADGYDVQSGTSMAAPHVSGAAALYLHAHPRAGVAEVRAAVLGSATTDVVRDLTPGTPNRLLYVGDLGADAVGPTPPATTPAHTYPAAMLLWDAWSADDPRVLTWPARRAGDEVVVGDWDGDGTDSPGLRRGNLLLLWNGDPVGEPDLTFHYGEAGEPLLIGDWDGDGTDGVGTRRGTDFHLRDAPSSGPATRVVSYGRATDVPVVGDWDGNGRDTIGVVRGNRFLLRDELRGGPADIDFWFGEPGEPFAVGDTDGDGRDSVTVHRGGVLHVRDSLTTGRAQRTVQRGDGTETLVLGDWTGTGTDTPGLTPGLASASA